MDSLNRCMVGLLGFCGLGFMAYRRKDKLKLAASFILKSQNRTKKAELGFF